MNKKQIIILVVVTNVISISLVSMIFILAMPEKEGSDLTKVLELQSNQTKRVSKKPQQDIRITIDSVMEQYDVIKSGLYQQSIDNYKQAIQKEPPYTADLTDGYMYAKRGDYEKAIKHSEEYIKISSLPSDYYTLAWIYAKIGQYDKSIYVCSKATQAHNQYSKIYHILAWLNVKQGENEKAIEACNKAFNLAPQSARVHYGLGRIYLMLEKNQKAIESYKQAVQIESDFSEAHLFLGLSYSELGDQKNAIGSYSEAIFLDKYYPEAYFFLGVAYDQSGEYNKAAESFKKAIKFYQLSEQTKTRIHGIGLKPDLANIHCIIGVCHLRLEQPFEASIAFKNAIKIDNSHVESHCGLALTHLLAGDKDAALMEYEIIKKVDSPQRAKKLLEIINR